MRPASLASHHTAARETLAPLSSARQSSSAHLGVISDDSNAGHPSGPGSSRASVTMPPPPPVEGSDGPPLRASTRTPEGSGGSNHGVTPPSHPYPSGLASSTSIQAQGFSSESVSNRRSEQSSGDGETGANEKGGIGTGPRRRRTKAGIKITRNRKITSCLPCRERKQKCDRTHPICLKCTEDGRECIYVDNEAGGDDASPENTAKRPRLEGPSVGPASPTLTASDGRQYSGAAAAAADTFLSRRRQAIAATYKAGRNRRLEFEDRVKAARAAAVAEVLFAEGGAQDLKVHGRLRLPTREQVGPLLDRFRADIQTMTNILFIDLNRGRIGSFLDWWHSNPVTLPPEADAPLAPLVLVILALSLQAKRTRDATETRAAGQVPQAFFTHNDPVLPYVSSERFLLETAGRCIDALQIACPSSWASAYSAPLDIVRAETLRSLWHLGECHLQFAGSSLGVALRLAYAAGLHRDPKHWTMVKMGDFEAQARRSAWWNIVYLEVFHSHRTGQPSSVVPDASDTELPMRFSAVIEQYDNLRSPYPRPDRASFDCMTARFKLAQSFLRQTQSVFGLHLPPRKVVHGLDLIHRHWEDSLPEYLRKRMDEQTSPEGTLETTTADEERDAKWEVFSLQLAMLQGKISVHRPYSDLTTGCAQNEAEAMRSLEICLEAASRLVHLCLEAVAKPPYPPYLLLNIVSYHTFNAGCMLAIQFVSRSPLSSLCRPAFLDALAVLDTLAENEALCNVSEQAERYAAAVRKIAVTPTRYQGPSRHQLEQPVGSEISSSPASSAVSRAAPTDDGEASGPGQVTESQPSVFAKPPTGSAQQEATEGWQHPPSTAFSAETPWSSMPAAQRRELPAPGADGDHAATSSTTADSQRPYQAQTNMTHPPMVWAKRSPSSASAGTEFGTHSAQAQMGEDFFTRDRAITALMDRPLPGSQQINLSHFGTLFPDEFEYVTNNYHGDGHPSSFSPFGEPPFAHPGSSAATHAMPGLDGDRGSTIGRSDAAGSGGVGPLALPPPSSTGTPTWHHLSAILNPPPPPPSAGPGGTSGGAGASASGSSHGVSRVGQPFSASPPQMQMQRREDEQTNGGAGARQHASSYDSNASHQSHSAHHPHHHPARGLLPLSSPSGPHDQAHTHPAPRLSHHHLPSNSHPTPFDPHQPPTMGQHLGDAHRDASRHSPHRRCGQPLRPGELAPTSHQHSPHFHSQHGSARHGHGPSPILHHDEQGPGHGPAPPMPSSHSGYPGGGPAPSTGDHIQAPSPHNGGGSGESASTLGQVDWYAWENFVSRLLQAE